MFAQLLNTTLLALQLPLVSDRLDFEDPDEISATTNQRILDFSTRQIRDSRLPELLNMISGKEVLLFVHGYNNTYEAALSAYTKYTEKTHEFYGQLVGYLWPGGDNGLEYHSARGRAVNDLDLRLLTLLIQMKSVAKSIDIYAHSMGCRVVLEALEMAPGKVVRNLFLTAPAVDNETLEIGERYYNSTLNCDRVVVFHSKEDEVLQYAYQLAEWDKALGYKGPENPEHLPNNVVVIDASKYVDHHSDYRNEEFVFDKIQDLLAQEN